MDRDHDNQTHPATDRLHPNIYLTIIGLALLFAAGSWGFAGGGYVDLTLVVVTGLISVAVAIPTTIYFAGRSESHDEERGTPLRDWLSGDFETWQDRVKGPNAMVEILLPIAAVAFGMVAFAIVLHAVELST